MEVGLDPGDFVFDRELGPPEKRAQPLPNFWPMSIVAEWIRMPLGTEKTSAQATLCEIGSQLPP